MSTRVLIRKRPNSAITRLAPLVRRGRAIFIALAICGVAGPSAVHAVVEPGETAYVQIQAGQLRQEPKHWAKRLEPLAYGDPVTVLVNADGWLRVRTSSGQEGFLHHSVVSERVVMLTGRTDAQGVESVAGEVVLAGKGFNEAVLREVAKQRGDLNFEPLARLERIDISSEALARFLAEGGLAGERKS